MNRTLVNGAGGFIGGHLVKRLKAEGFWVRGVDIKPHEFAAPPADEFIIGDLRDPIVVAEAVAGHRRGLPTRRRYGRSRLHLHRRTRRRRHAQLRHHQPQRGSRPGAWQA